MKRQTGFISSSSSVAVRYSTVAVGTVVDHVSVTNWTTTGKGNAYSIMTQLYDSYDSTQSIDWKSYASNSYERIEYFLEATERLGEPLSKDSFYYQNFSNYSVSAANANVYNGFIDLVITLPCEMRLAGIELINPWVSERFGSEYSSYWTYLPTKFSIYKVNHEKQNEALDNLSYENDVANISDYNKQKTLRALKYDRLDQDKNLTLLGTYKNVYWKGLSSYKCFFRFNQNDPASANIGLNQGSIGTATWKCKQLVLRIYETRRKLNHFNTVDPSSELGDTYIKNLIYDYILQQEKSYGTKYNGRELTLAEAKMLLGLKEISSLNNPTNDPNWKFGSEFFRSYNTVADVKFKSGLDYKLGGIQLLLSPDVFSISEMKMYQYDGKESSKVYIGEYDPEIDEAVYYGAKNLHQSPYINIESNSELITWKHNFNIPPNYLDVKLYVRFNIEYDSFNVGDIISNITNCENEPLSIKVTDNEACVNISNGIGFTNPTTGEFISFKNGRSIQMDRPGNFDALTAALDVGATVIDAGSSVAASISGGTPFQVYFVAKRLF